MTRLRTRLTARIAALGVATLGLSACYYDAGVGLGYYDDGYSYYDDGYGCDPYSPFDSYYDCDYRGGFYNIGYGGGWYQDYWYPGYGFYIFDRGGKRHKMYDHHRRYWSGKRHEWYREHHRRDGYDGRKGHDGRRDRDDRRKYHGADGTSGWSGQTGGRTDDRSHDRYRDRNATGNGQPDIWHRDRRRDDRRGDGRSERRHDWSQNRREAAQSAPPVVAPQAPAPAGRSWRRNGESNAPRAGDGNRRNWQAPPPQQSQQGTATPIPVPQPRMARPGRNQQGAARNNERGPREN